jgi:hypothetical protein
MTLSRFPRQEDSSAGLLDTHPAVRRWDCLDEAERPVGMEQLHRALIEAGEVDLAQAAATD